MTVPLPSDQRPKVTFERERGIYALRVTHDVAHAVVYFTENSTRTASIQKTFNVLAEAGIPLFLVKLHQTSVTFAVAGYDLPNAEKALSAADLKMKTRRDLAVVTIVAAAMREISGVMVAISDALYTAGARLYEMGDSHDSVQCLIEAERAEEAVAVLCRTFDLGSDCVQELRLAAEDTA